MVMPPILSMDVAENNGEIDVKTAYIEGVPQLSEGRTLWNKESNS